MEYSERKGVRIVLMRKCEEKVHFGVAGINGCIILKCILLDMFIVR
jgi:hypothetical protein